MLLNLGWGSESSWLLIRGYARGCPCLSVRRAASPLGAIYLSEGAEVNLLSGALGPIPAGPLQAHMQTPSAGPAQPRITGDTDKVLLSQPPHIFHSTGLWAQGLGHPSAAQCLPTCPGQASEKPCG